MEKRLLTCQILLFLFFNSSLRSYLTSASQLADDLNMIATRVDEIPETSLNLKMVLVAQECNDVKLNWKIQNNKSNKNSIFKVISNFKKTFNENTKIFGYQVVVREILESFKPKSKTNDFKEKTLRVYSSKFIESNQNKFKLVNLLRKDQATYSICLVIYIDVTETVAFEKQCVNFSLPIVSDSTELECQKTKISKLKTTTSMSELLVPKGHTENSTNESGQNDLANVDNESINKTSDNSNNKHQQQNPLTKSKSIGYSNCEHISQCRHYSNLLVAFVICGVLLATNVFMFTIIIIQNTIKLNILREKIRNYQKNHRRDGTYDDQSKRFLQNQNSIFLCCTDFETLKSAFSNSCMDIFTTICCGTLLKDVENSKASNKKYLQDDSDKHCDLSTTSQSCTTITRPGYILQVPNATLSSSSILNSSDKTSNFSRSTATYYKPNFFGNNNAKAKIIANHSQNFSFPPPPPQHSDDSLGSSSCIDHDLKDLDGYENEVFYHTKYAHSQASSAF
jgi:hypothetical protein